MLALRCGGAVLDLIPEIGGAIARFAVEGVDVLRPAPAGTSDVLATGCFPLVPFANRIAHGTFNFAAETVHLSRNFGEHPHPLHGQGWQGRWTIREQATDAAVLAFEHPGGEWPWAFAAEQVFRLSADALRMELALSNRSSRAMPFSLGFHPYLPRTRGTVIRANVAGVWLADDTGIPTVAAGPSRFLDLQNGAALAAVDHCHFGWHGRALVEQPGRTLEFVASPELAFLHLYVPQNGEFLCVEPVSAMPDAFNRPEPGTVTGLRVLAPGESQRVAMTLTVRSHR